MKKLKGLVVTGMLMTAVLGGLLGHSVVAAAETNIQVKVDGGTVNFPDSKPFIDRASNRTMIPVRFVSEKLGAKVEWDNSTRTVTLDKAGRQIALKIGENKATVSGKQISFDAAAKIQDSRTYVPLRFVSEAYGAKVVWDKINQVVYINTTEKVRDATGTKLFQQFQSSLTVKNGILTGKLPAKSTSNLLINLDVGFNNEKKGKVLENGESFSFPISELESFAFLVYDREHGKVLINYAYRSLPDLTGLDVTDL